MDVDGIRGPVAAEVEVDSRDLVDAPDAAVLGHEVEPGRAGEVFVVVLPDRAAGLSIAFGVVPTPTERMISIAAWFAPS